MKDLYIVSKVLQGRFTESRPIRSITLLANMSIEVKVWNEGNSQMFLIGTSGNTSIVEFSRAMR